MSFKKRGRVAVAGVSLIAVVCGLGLPASAEESWVEKSNAYSQQLLQLLAKYNPEQATMVGVASADADVEDLRPHVLERQTADAEKIIAKLKVAMTKETDPSLKQDLAIMVDALEDGITSEKLHNRVEIPYYNLPQTIYSGFRSLLGPGSDKSRHEKAVLRLKRYAGLVEGYTPIVQLAEARTTERLGDKKLIGPYIGEINQDFKRMPVFIGGIEKLFKDAGLTGWEDAYATLKTQLTGYKGFVEKQIVPRARQSARLPLPLYQDALKQWGVDATPEQLIAMAQLGYAEIKDEMKALAPLVAKEKGYKTTDYHEVIKLLKKENIPGDQVEAFYKHRIDQLEDIARKHNLVTIPDRKAKVRMMTAAETAANPAPNLQPPRFVGGDPDHKEYATFRLPLLKKNADGTWQHTDDTFKATTWTLAAHEARPGHELQFGAMVDHGVSLARQLYAFNSTNVEGWALYAEAMSKPYMPLDGQLLSLQNRLLRAARCFLDPMLNLGLISPADAKRLLKEDVVLGEGWAQNEIERYTYRMPGQATAYFYGYTKLMALQTEVQLRLRDKYSAKAFHDFILAQGLLPPDLMRKAVLDRFVPSVLGKKKAS
ncbi:DUF885 domain-containing protein [Kordiimonas marina]|uniref:DUF885 domain-containing protein n=1 Tax=Kordiimonas marina TaxID=2872312 RepID=UPI001FF35765|nr:DUF885 domain-containing protein [Kordiimonas marina]MCJ9429488.1 DUF885 domain-containing protein [Kordiimonas marina]